MKRLTESSSKSSTRGCRRRSCMSDPCARAQLEAQVKSLTAQLKIQQNVIEQLMTAMSEDEKRTIIEKVIESLGLRRPRVWNLGALVEEAAEKGTE